MRMLAITLLLCSLATPALAQHTAEVAQVHTLAACIGTTHTQLARVARLLDEARARSSSTDSSVRHDAELSIETLLQRAAEAREALRTCIAAASFTAPTGETVVHTTTPDDAADHVAASGGSIHEVESDAALSEHVRVVRGERVDGAGSATDAAIRSAVHGAGHAMSVCYDAYVDRAAIRHGTVHVSFTVNEGGRVTNATVERGGFDTQLRQCMQTAVSAIHVAGAHGTSVFAYEISLGD